MSENVSNQTTANYAEQEMQKAINEAARIRNEIQSIEIVDSPKKKNWKPTIKKLGLAAAVAAVGYGLYAFGKASAGKVDGIKDVTDSLIDE